MKLNIALRSRIKKGLYSAGWNLLALLLLATGPISGSTASALTKAQSDALHQGIYYFNTEVDACEILAKTVLGGSVNLTTTQEDNAKTIIGIAKTLGLGKQGALIGLMVGLTESKLKNYANSGTYKNPKTGEQPYIRTQLGPISTSLPHDEVGNDNDSVGIMQQRAVDGHWGPVDPKKDLAGNIKWLMTPAYAAEAFFTMPVGKTESKALVRVDGWQSMAPELAAQRVQVSAFDDGRNYKAKQNAAQKLLDRLWDNAPLVPLPFPVQGGGEGGPVIGSPPVTPVNNPCPQLDTPADAHQAILNKIFEYAWPEYCRTNGVIDGTRIPCEPLVKKDKYQEAVKRSRYKGDPCHGGGVDCGAFVTIVMRESRADPNYNTGPQGNTTQQLAYLERNSKAGGKYTKITPKSEKDLKPGDIAIRERGDFGLGGHTFFYVGTAPSGVNFGTNINKRWKAASASQCFRAPMASTLDTISEYYWFRLNVTQDNTTNLQV